MIEADVRVAAPEERGAVANLLQLYVHDFSEFWAGLSVDQLGGNAPFAEVGDDGRFAELPLDAYWGEPDHIPLLIRVAGRLAGFALVDKTSHTGRPLERNMAEFFVVRRHRREGLGLAAAHTIFSRYPGRWEAAIARRNTRALPFWRRTVASHPDVAEIEELDLTGPRWNGPVLCFRIGTTA